MKKSKILFIILAIFLITVIIALILFNKKENQSNKENLTTGTINEIGTDVDISEKEKDLQTSSNLKVGDYVNYTYDTTNNYELPSEISGYSQNQTIPQEELKWRILEINEDGSVKLVCDQTTSYDIYFNSYLGYNNGVFILNDICKSQYSNSKLGTIARNICIEDIESILSETGLSKISEYSNYFTNVKYGETKTYTGYYPSLYSKEIGTNSINLSNSYYDSATTDKYEKSDTNGLTITQNYYYLANVSTTDVKNDDIYDILFKTPLHYWISTRYTSATSSNSCAFGLRCTKIHSITGVDMFSSSGSSYGDSKYLRPIVELPSNLRYSYNDGIWNIEIQENNSTTTENSNVESIELEKDLNLNYEKNGAFLMTVDNIYTLTGRGTMVEGTILRGSVKAGDTIQILGIDSNVKTTTIDRVEQSRKEIPEGKIGENVTVLLHDYHRSEIFVGQVLAQENSILVSNNIKVSIQMNDNKDIKTLENLSDLNGYFRNINIPCKLSLIDEKNNNIINLLLDHSVAVERGMKFPIKNGNNIIAECTVIDIY